MSRGLLSFISIVDFIEWSCEPFFVPLKLWGKTLSKDAERDKKRLKNNEMASKKGFNWI